MKYNKNDIENLIEKTHDVRENMLYMLAFEKLIRDEQQKVIEPILKDDEKKHCKENDLNK